MPSFEFSFKDLQRLTGKKLPRKPEKLWDKLLYVKAEVEEFKKDDLKVEEADTNRPDLWCVEGLARALKGALSVETGLPVYKSKSSKHVLKVNNNVKKIRPYIAAAVVKGLSFDDNIIKQLIQLQLKLDTTYGRNRKKSAIGVYDFDKIIFPITYKTVKPNSVEFTPLGFEKSMKLSEILETHPKGLEFGSIIRDYKRYPLLVDKKGSVLSMPPVINSNDVGRVTKNTKNVFIEVTGNSMSTVLGALNIITSALADRGGKVEEVTIQYGKKKVITPDFKPRIMKVRLQSIKKRLGLKLTKSQITSLLKRARFGIKGFNNKFITVLAPFYRTDVMHEFDIIEDIGIMYGYSKIKSQPVGIASNGSLLPETSYLRVLRKLASGMGYQEVLNYYRIDKSVLFNEDCIEIANPIGATMNVLRNELLPVALNLLSKNTHNEYPQRIFEAGRVFIKSKNKVLEDNHLVMVSVHAEADFTEIKKAVDWLLNNLKVKHDIVEHEHNAFISGRCAGIRVNNELIGYFGELHPRALVKFNLENPAAALEINIEKIR